MKSIITLSTLALAILLLPGCGAHYQQKQLKHLDKGNSLFEQTKDNVLLRVHPLNKSESDKIFDGRGYYLLRDKNPLQAIQITVFNKTDHIYILSSDMIDLSLSKSAQVIKAIEYDRTAQTIIPLIIGAAAVTARVAAAGDSRYDQHCATADSVALGVGTAAFAAGNNAQAKNANELLADDVTDKMLSCDGMVIKPFEKVSSLVFVEKRNMRPGFMLSLQRNDQALLTYEVTV
ncbi:hypothetical protein BH09DEP1_BH09DEP1_6240 [soil metagenome]